MNKRQQILQAEDKRIAKAKSLVREIEIEKRMVEELFSGFNSLILSKEPIYIRNVEDNLERSLSLHIEVNLPSTGWRMFLEVNGRAIKEANNVPMSDYKDPFLLLDETKLKFDEQDAIYYARLWIKDVYPELADREIKLMKEKTSDGERISENREG